MNAGLLSEFLHHDLRKERGLRILLPLLKDITPAIYRKLGRDAVDLVWDNIEEKSDFFRLAANVLYEGRSVEELPVPSLHRQIASMSKALLFTTNYDPLLELALLRVREGVRLQPGTRNDDWKKFRESVSWDQKTSYEKGKVYHIHGCVEPSGTTLGQCIFTEGHYFELARNSSLPANRTLLDILQGDGVLLIVGMSLADSNLRRLLYQRRKEDIVSRPVYAVLKEEEELVAAYQEVHWRQRDVKLLWLRDYDQMEDLLRQIKFGPGVVGQEPVWASEAARWLSSDPSGSPFFGDDWQRKAHRVLQELRDQLSLLFPVGAGERIEVAVLVPVILSGLPPQLAMVCRTQDGVLTGVEALERAKLFSFGIKFGQAHGSSGTAYVRGLIDEVLDDTLWAHRNIPPDRMKGWYSDRWFQDWRSILSIPVADSPDWFPVGVVALTSNFARPFWARFDEDRDRYLGQLKAIVRGVAGRYLLRAESVTNLA
ncbi:MAG: SIR2 family protein [Bryobacteraceae bacterium]